MKLSNLDFREKIKCVIFHETQTALKAGIAASTNAGFLSRRSTLSLDLSCNEPSHDAIGDSLSYGDGNNSLLLSRGVLTNGRKVDRRKKSIVYETTTTVRR